MASQSLRNAFLRKPKDKTQLYSWFTSGSFVSASYFLLFYLIFDPWSMMFYICLGIVLVYLLLHFLVLWTGAKKQFFVIAVGFGYLSFFIHIALTGGISSSAAPHLIVAALFSFFFTYQKRIFVFFGISLFLLFGLGISDTYFIDPINLIRDDMLLAFNFSNHAYSAIVIFFFVYVFRAMANANNQSLKKSLSELGEATKKLVEVEKFASLGELTAGLAHEINNPVNYVQGNAILIRKIVGDLFKLEAIREEQEEQLRKYLSNRDGQDPQQMIEEMLAVSEVHKKKIEYSIIKDELAQLLDGLRHGVRRTSEIVKSLRIYSSAGNTVKSAFDLNQSVESALTLLNHLIVGKVEVNKDLGTIPKVNGNPGKVSQVIINVVSNAIQSIEVSEKGIIAVKTYLAEEDQKVVVSISDNGPGIPEKVLPKIFDPFYTTKEVGTGTGLGLSISKGIVEEHEGEIRVDTAQGKGTTFHIALPLAKVAG
ncbi:MAG: ATP-binding protein [Cytophagales bacterium]|nr:ATP-binding protein [Cytophagales bacterium]